MASKIHFRQRFIVNIFFAGLCLLTHSLSAQFVSLPDPAFVNWLGNNGYQSCLSGSELDTTCLLVLNSKQLDISYIRVSNLYGIQYFKGLDSLRCNDDSGLVYIPFLPPHLKLFECHNDSISSLPPLPDSLFWLSCESNWLASLPPLPPMLTYLTCYNNLLSSLPPLPGGLQLFYCNGNQLDSLPVLPDSLTILSCFGNKLARLPALPGNLQILLCSHNLLQSLPALPASLTTLDCGINSLSVLPALPDSLNYLGCYHNRLTGLPALPPALTQLNCEYNMLTSLPDLPDSLNLLYCDNNTTLLCLPQLNTIWDLEFYNTGVSCLPDYGNVYISEPALTSIPLCDSSNNAHGCLMLSGIKEPETFDITIYPNPATNVINLLFKTPTSNAMEFELLNALGQTVMKRQLGAGQTSAQYSTTALCNAIYYWQLKNSQRIIQTGKLVVIK